MLEKNNVLQRRAKSEKFPPKNCKSPNISVLIQEGLSLNLKYLLCVILSNATFKKFHSNFDLKAFLAGYHNKLPKDCQVKFWSDILGQRAPRPHDPNTVLLYCMILDLNKNKIKAFACATHECYI